MSKNDALARWRKRVADIKESYPFALKHEVIIKRNLEGSIHCDDGPAYISKTRLQWFQDGKQHGLDIDIYGSKSYYFEGVLIPPRYFLDPESLTFEEIINHPNTEVRYVGLKIYGYDRVREKCKIIDKGKDGMELMKLEQKNLSEPLMILKVLNSTPEADGTQKSYFLVVPPDMKTAEQAVAWTFRFDKPKDYHPEQEA